jgi:hypothetical protein
VQQEIFALSGAPLGTCRAALQLLKRPRLSAVWLAARFGDEAVARAVRHRLHEALRLLLNPRFLPHRRLSSSPIAQVQPPFVTPAPLCQLQWHARQVAEGLMEAVQVGDAEACSILLAHRGLPDGEDMMEAAARYV